MQTKNTNTQKLLFNLHAKFGKAMKSYGLVEDGDKILIGISGGKDSLAMIELFAKRMHVFKPKFSVEAAHISVRNIPYQADIEYLKQYCESFNIPFHHITTEFDASTDTRKSPCFLCSWNRRKMLFETALKHNCNKIALGHHQDDILQTLLMNITFQGAFSTMPPLLKMNKMDINIIRPLCLIKESDLEKMANIRGFKKQIKNCVYEQNSHRTDIKRILKEIEHINPDARYSIWASMNNIQEEYLPQKNTINKF